VDLIGSEFAGPHMLYERLSAGNSIIVRNQSDRGAPWECFPCCSGRLRRINAPDFLAVIGMEIVI